MIYVLKPRNLLLHLSKVPISNRIDREIKFRRRFLFVLKQKQKPVNKFNNVGFFHWYVRLEVAFLWDTPGKPSLMSPYMLGEHSETSTVIYLSLRYLGPDKMDAISQTTFSNVFSWMKMYEFSFEMSLKFVPNFQINNITALVQIIPWRRLGVKAFIEPMMVSLSTRPFVTLGLNKLKYSTIYGAWHYFLL